MTGSEAATPQMSILFVCTGNICRSPIGERVLTGLAGRAGVPVTSSSAGVGALNGQPIHPHASAVLANSPMRAGVAVGPVWGSTSPISTVGLQSGEVATVDTESLAGDVAGPGADQEGNGRTDVGLGIADATNGDSSGQSSLHRGICLDGCRHRG